MAFSKALRSFMGEEELDLARSGAEAEAEVWRGSSLLKTAEGESWSPFPMDFASSPCTNEDGTVAVGVASSLVVVKGCECSFETLAFSDMVDGPSPTAAQDKKRNAANAGGFCTWCWAYSQMQDNDVRCFFFETERSMKFQAQSCAAIGKDQER